MKAVTAGDEVAGDYLFDAVLAEAHAGAFRFEVMEEGYVGLVDVGAPAPSRASIRSRVTLVCP